MLTNKVIRQASNCDTCIARKFPFLKIKSFKDPGNLIINVKSKIIKPLENMLPYCLKCRENT